MIPRIGRISTVDIRERLKNQYGIEISLRTVQRDLVALEQREFPLVCDNCRPAGWSWMKDAPGFDLPNMDPVTALTFTLTRQYLTRMLPKGALSALDTYFSTAEERLKQTGESSLSRWPGKVRVMSRNLVTIPPVVSPEISERVYTAVLEERRFKAIYRTISGKVSAYKEVHPLGMTFVDGLTYLIATINQHVDPVLLLLHRFQSVELLDEPVTVPEGFDFDAVVAELLTFQIGETISLKLRFSSQSDINRLEESPLADNQNIRTLPGGRYELSASVEDTLQLRWWLHGFGARVEVMAPNCLRQEFVELAKNYTEIYCGAPDKTTENIALPYHTGLPERIVSPTGGSGMSETGAESEEI